MKKIITATAISIATAFGALVALAALGRKTQAAAKKKTA